MRHEDPARVAEGNVPGAASPPAWCRLGAEPGNFGLEGAHGPLEFPDPDLMPRQTLSHRAQGDAGPSIDDLFDA